MDGITAVTRGLSASGRLAVFRGARCHRPFRPIAARDLPKWVAGIACKRPLKARERDRELRVDSARRGPINGRLLRQFNVGLGPAAFAHSTAARRLATIVTPSSELGRQRSSQAD